RRECTRRRGAPRPRARASLAKPLDRLEERLVVRRALERLLPDAVRFAALAQHPQYFAEMGADLGVRTAVVGAAQRLRGTLEVAFAVLHPAEAIDNEIILGRELERLLDQLARFAEARVALGERVAERVVGMRVVGLHLDQLPQVALERVVLLELFRGEREVVQELRLIGLALQRLAEEPIGILRAIRVAQELSFRDGELHLLAGMIGGRLVQ